MEKYPRIHKMLVSWGHTPQGARRVIEKAAAGDSQNRAWVYRVWFLSR